MSKDGTLRSRVVEALQRGEEEIGRLQQLFGFDLTFEVLRENAGIWGPAFPLLEMALNRRAKIGRHQKYDERWRATLVSDADAVIAKDRQRWPNRQPLNDRLACLRLVDDANKPYRRLKASTLSGYLSRGRAEAKLRELSKRMNHGAGKSTKPHILHRLAPSKISG
jgi:hypothetical protein